MSIDILAHLIEVLSGCPRQDFPKERVFSPLGISDTGFSVSAENSSRVAVMYGHPDIATHQFTAIVTSATGPVDVSKTYPNDNTITFARGHGLFSTALDCLQLCPNAVESG